MGMISATGSMLEVEVVPTVATIQNGKIAVALVFLNRRGKRARVHAKLRVGRNLAQAALAQAERNHGFFD